MALLIVGTGALACLFATKLIRSGNEVTMMGSWTEGLDALRMHGVRMLDMEGNIHSYPVDVMEGDKCQGEYSKSIVLVKSWQTERAAQRLKSCLSSDGITLTLQNGLGNDEVLKSILNPERVALGVTTVGARMLEPGYVQFTGNGKIFLGSHPRITDMAELLGKSGFQVELVHDPVALLWGKLVINAAINPLSALLRVTNGELIERQTARELLAEAALEAATVAAKQGISLPYLDPVLAVEEVARNTAGNHSSMLQDVLRGTMTEIEAINGAIVRVGEQTGVPTPINRILWKLVKSIDQN